MKALVHELMHVLGFYHEQQRPDRDLYISVLYQNIVKTNDIKRLNYDINPNSTPLGNYDFLSVLHYNPFGFSVNGLPTIIPNKCKVSWNKNKHSITCPLLKKMIKKSNEYYSSPLSHGDICSLQYIYGKPNFLTKKTKPCLSCKTTWWRIKRTKNNHIIYYRFIYKYNNECIKIEIDSLSGKKKISIIDI
jgi:hypothetical protein